MLDKSKYVVLDVETNGTIASEEDLLSISIYDPYTEESYDRFLPLELNDFVYTTHINGITEEMLEDKEPINQDEFDDIIRKFKLEDRIILTYGSIDEKFIRIYCKRHKLKNFDKLNFFNFKHLIISSKFSTGVVTKDNLCKLFNIDNVTEIHSGKNDCILEWKLFEKIYDKQLLITGTCVFELNDKYVIPISYLETYPNFKYYRDIPEVYIRTKTVKKFPLSIKVDRYDTNISGIAIENLINSMLEAEKVNSKKFELTNKFKLNRIGNLPSMYHEIPVVLGNDGKIISVNRNNDEFINRVNRTTEKVRKEIIPMIDYLKNNLFKNGKILSQELIINEECNVLSKCDLSNEDLVLELKTNFDLNFDKIKMQLYFESNGRNVYVLNLDWKHLEFVLTKVEFISKEENNQIKSEERIKNNKKKFEKKLINKNLKVLSYINCNNPVKLQCKLCNFEWESSVKKIMDNPICPNCNPDKKVSLIEKKIMQSEVVKKDYGKQLKEKVFLKSNGKLAVLRYYGAKSNAEVGCLDCNYTWKIRPDHLLDRCYCPKCRNKGE